MSDKMPWMQFYPSDWSRDTTPLSLAARGAWITIVCEMWHSKKRGKLSLTLAGYCRLLGAPAPEVMAVIEELTQTEVCENLTRSNKNITLVCRRMRREEKKRQANRLRQKRFYKKTHPNAPITDKTSEGRSQKAEVISTGRTGKKEKLPTALPGQKMDYEKTKPPEINDYGDIENPLNDPILVAIAVTGESGKMGWGHWLKKLNRARKTLGHERADRLFRGCLKELYGEMKQGECNKPGAILNIKLRGI